MIKKYSNYTPLFGINTNEGYKLLNRANEVVMVFKDEESVFVNDIIEWKITAERKPNYLTPVYRLTKMVNNEEEYSSILPNRRMILIANNKIAKSKSFFMFYPEPNNQLERLLVKNGIYNFKDIIEKNLNSTYTTEYDIFWVSTPNEHYPYKISIHSSENNVYKKIVKELLE